MPKATPTPEIADIKDQIRAQAREAGFDIVRFAPADLDPEVTRRFEDFLSREHHGDMSWVADHATRRSHPKNLWPDARSAIVLGMNYAPESDPLKSLEDKMRGVVSCYARGKDYHVIVKKALKKLAGWLYRETGNEVKVFVDTAPLLEKPLAERAGLGWQGKHTNLVSSEFGSWLFLGSILTSLEIEPDDIGVQSCGTCQKCLDICPTSAFPGPFELDARRCISYLTIEYKGHIEPEFRQPMGNRIYGCDDCLAVCPWNKFAKQAREIRFLARPETDNPPLAELLVLDEDAFRDRFKGTPVKRATRNGLVRNVLIAAGNSADPSLLPLIRPLLKDPSDIVRAMAVWALGRLTTGEEFENSRADYEMGETDDYVKAEWSRGGLTL